MDTLKDTRLLYCGNQRHLCQLFPNFLYFLIEHLVQNLEQNCP